MRGTLRIALGLLLTCTLALAVGSAAPGHGPDQAGGRAEVRPLSHVPPQWFDPGEVRGFITPFWFLSITAASSSSNGVQ
jgi:hypothetical protein